MIEIRETVFKLDNLYAQLNLNDKIVWLQLYSTSANTPWLRAHMIHVTKQPSHSIQI